MGLPHHDDRWKDGFQVIMQELDSKHQCHGSAFAEAIGFVIFPL